MKEIDGINLAEVQAVYSGPEGDLWELIMGEQIHIGGFQSSMELAETAGVGEGMRGIDLCCCNGAGMRFLVRFRSVSAMHGVDATVHVVERGSRRTEAEGLADRITFTLADVTETGLAGGEADFVWGEDAWCYVVDKERLIAEAVRLVKPGGTIAFTDWIEGPAGLSAEEALRFLTFMKFPGVQDLDGYRELLVRNGCEVVTPRDQVCCGSLHGHNGDLTTARQLARRNLDVFDLESIDAIVVNAAGCGSFMRQYDHLLADEPEYAEKARVWTAMWFGHR